MAWSSFTTMAAGAPVRRLAAAALSSGTRYIGRLASGSSAIDVARTCVATGPALASSSAARRWRPRAIAAFTTAGVVAIPSTIATASKATDRPISPCSTPPSAAAPTSMTANVVKTAAARYAGQITESQQHQGEGSDARVARAEQAQGQMRAETQRHRPGQPEQDRHPQGKAELAGDHLWIGRCHREQDG